MSSVSHSPYRPALWFAFGFLIYFVWILANISEKMPALVFALGPLAFILTVLLIRLPGLRRKSTEQKTDRIQFISAMGGGFVGAIVGVIVKAML